MKSKRILSFLTRLGLALILLTVSLPVSAYTGLPGANSEPATLTSPIPVCTLPGDDNGDGDITVGDITAVASSWGAGPGDAGWDTRYDLDADGDIDIQDIMLLLSQWGAAGTLPESPADGELGLRVAYVHAGDTATGMDFRALLHDQGFLVALWPQADIANGDFSACDLLLIGADTQDWAADAGTQMLLDTGRPIAGIGAGGFDFLSAADVLTGLTSGTGDASVVQATLRGHKAYEFPNPITLDVDQSIQVFTAASSASWLDLVMPLPDGVEIGRLPGTTNYPIVQLQKRFILWGFDDGPAAMTPAGQELFVNVLGFQGEQLQVPLRSRHFAPQQGVEQGLMGDLASKAEPNLHAYAQLAKPASHPDCEALRNYGIVLLYRVWDRLYVASVAAGSDPTDPAVRACVRWMGKILPADKVMPKVLAGQFEDWADNGDGTVNLLVTFYPDVSDSQAMAVLDAHVVSYEARGMKTWAVIIDKTEIVPLSQADAVRWIQEGPVPYLPDNDVARQELFVDEVQEASISGGSIEYGGLDGSGIQVSIHDGRLDNTHDDFAGRVIRVGTHALSDHGTHVAGIVGASGVRSDPEGGTDFQWRGMAPGVELAAFSSSTDDTGDFDEAYNTLGVDISNHSYTQTCMRYDSSQANIDSIIRGDADNGGTAIPARPYHKSAGNNGSSSQYCSDTGVEGYYSVTGVAKNQTVVGSLNPSTDYALRYSSARGPTYDGRLKPDIMAIGYMKSTIPGDTYGYKGGTSMAAPATTGVAALTLQQYGNTYGTVHPLPSTVKALLINNATDLVHDPDDPGYSAYTWDDPDTGDPVIFHQGPDFSTGYGVVNAERTINAVRHKAAIESQLDSDADVDEYTIQVLEGREELRFTLAWDDPPADSTLDEDASHLVNDLDLVLEDPNGGLHYPWVLDPPPHKDDFDSSGDDPIDTDDITPAYRAEDHVNNVEQVVVWADDVDPGDWAGTWTVRVSATDLDDAPQRYSLVGEWREISLQDIYPLDAGYNAAPDTLIIPVRVRNPYLASPKAAGGVSASNWQVRIGDAASSSWTDATVDAAYGPVGDLAYLVVRPPNTLAAGILYDIEVTLRDVYQVDQREAEAYQDIDTTTREDAIFFLAEARAPVDEMIVVDNSGSMGDYGKLESAQNAARAFADRREQDDMIGLAYFESSAGTLYDLTLVTAGETELNDVKTEIGNMTAGGSTALGSGMLEGKDQLDSKGDASHTWHMVLLSDGMENVPPCWDTGPGNPYCDGEASVQSDFVPAEGCPDIKVDTVSIGPEDASWRDLLEDIAEQTCGEAWNATVDESGSLAMSSAKVAVLEFPQTLHNTLANIYTSIADGNTHQERLWEEVGVLAIGETINRNVDVPGGLSEATFAVNWPDGGYMRFGLFRPDGTPVNPGDIDAHVKQDSTHTVFRMDAPMPGPWKLQFGASQSEGGTEYLAVVSANTDVTLYVDFGLAPPQRVVGALMPIYAVVVDKAGPIKNANVRMVIQRPGGLVDGPLPMVDDGTHGDDIADDGVYTGLYLIPLPGNYEVKVRAEGQDNAGQHFLRYRHRQFRVQRRPQVAYIHAGDMSTAADFKALLAGDGLDMTPIDIGAVTTVDLNPFDLIIIGHETGSGATWGDAATIAHIQDARKPIIGLGEGGNAYFGKLDLFIGYPNGQPAADADVLQHDPADLIWHEPYDIAKRLVPVYQGNGSSGVAIDVSQPPPDVKLLAKRPQYSQYWLAQEEVRYLMWGFKYGPADMTETGRALFLNMVWYAFPWP